MLARRVNGVPLIPLVFFAVAGVVALVLGLRGRKIDDHPICRKCRFDLVGVWPAIGRCPECGSELARRRAVMDGQWRKRWLSIVLGSVLLVLSLLIGGGLAYRQYASLGWNGLKPVVLLRWEARRAPGWGTAGYQAFTELRRRFAVGELDAATVDSLVSEALAMRLDESRPWNPGWGDFFAQAAGAGRVTPEQHRKYLLNLVWPTIWIQPRIRAGTVPEHRLQWATPPGNQSYRAGAQVDVGAFRLELVRIEVDGAPVPLAPPVQPGETVYQKDYWSPPGRRWTYSVVGPEPPGFPAINAGPGKHEVTVVWNVCASRRQGDDDVLAAWEARHSQEIEVFAQGQPMVEPVVDESQREAMRAAFDVELRIWSSRGDPPHLEGAVRTRGAPVHCAFRIDLRFGDAEFDSNFQVPATVYAGPEGTGSSFFRPAPRGRDAPEPRSGDVVRVILTPDAEMAAKHGILKMWGEPIEYEVEVR